ITPRHSEIFLTSMLRLASRAAHEAKADPKSVKIVSFLNQLLSLFKRQDASFKNKAAWIAFLIDLYSLYHNPEISEFLQKVTEKTIQSSIKSRDSQIQSLGVNLYNQRFEKGDQKLKDTPQIIAACTILEKNSELDSPFPLNNLKKAFLNCFQS